MIKQRWFLYRNEIYSIRYTDTCKYITVYCPSINAWSSHYLDDMSEVPEDMNVEDGEELDTSRLDEEVKKKKMLLELQK